MARIRARELGTLDAQGRIAFGKYMYSRFADVPLEYYCWARVNVKLDGYPQLREYLSSIRGTLDTIDII